MKLRGPSVVLILVAVTWEPAKIFRPLLLPMMDHLVTIIMHVEHLPLPRIRTPTLPSLSPRILSIKPPRCFFIRWTFVGLSSLQNYGSSFFARPWMVSWNYFIIYSCFRKSYMNISTTTIPSLKLLPVRFSPCTWLINF